VRRELHAEWTKLRTGPSTTWLLLAAIATTVAVSGAAAAEVRCPAVSCDVDPAVVSLTGIQLGQAIVATLAVLAVADEYGTGLASITLVAMPRRTTVLVAKAAVLAAVVTLAATIAVPACLLAARLLLPHPLSLQLSPADGSVLRAAAGSVLYFALIALLGAGVATAVRSSAAAAGIVLALLYIFPILAQAVDPHWRRLIQQIGPMTAGLTVEATTHVGDLPIAPWAGLGVAAAWALAALLTGGLLLQVRDA
jgi:ABC-2 type transport system permease protein